MKYKGMMGISGSTKIAQLEKTARAYNVLNNSDANAVFTIYGEDDGQGFSLNCTPLNNPGGSLWQQYYICCERETKLGIYSRLKLSCVLGTCRWKWAKDKTDIIALTVYTGLRSFLCPSCW
jgi:hypothetical protein